MPAACHSEGRCGGAADDDGRDEDDVMREVTEHGGSPLDPGKQSKTEACFMECMYLIGRAA